MIYFKEFRKIGDPEASFDFGYFFVFLWILFGLGLYLGLKRISSQNFKRKISSVTKSIQLLLQVLPEE